MGQREFLWLLDDLPPFSTFSKGTAARVLTRVHVILGPIATAMPTTLDEAAVTEVDNDVLKLGTWTAGARTDPYLFVRVVLPPREWQHTAAR